MRKLSIAALAALAASFTPSSPVEAPLAAQTAPDRCASLSGFTLPGHVIKITKAGEVAATDRAPAHCLVEGDINPRTGMGGKPYALGFAIALPQTWSGRFMFQGGGGYNGSVRPPLAAQTGGPSALARGFAVVSTDSGHKGGTPAFFEDQQATLDFAQNSIGTVTLVGKKIVEAFYSREPHHSYFVGCSNGGREAMTAAQRFPAMFDGVVAGDPGMRAEYTIMSSAWATTVYNRAAPKDAAGKPLLDKLYSAADRKLVLGRLLERCDSLDGMKDGLIFNTGQCRFDPAELICKGAKNDSCLSRAQAEAIKTAIAGPKTRAGLTVYPAYPYDTENLMGRFMPGAPTGTATPPSTAVTMDVDKAWADIIADGTWQLISNSAWTNYSAFFGRGGKLIFTHGLSDQAFSPNDTTAYYQRLLKDNGGAEKARASSRLFLIPGRSHCGGGSVTMTQFDTLAALVDWVEQGRAPDWVSATVSNAPDSKRPLCAWPAYAHYKGSGDARDAASYECRAGAVGAQ